MLQLSVAHQHLPSEIQRVGSAGKKNLAWIWGVVLLYLVIRKWFLNVASRCDPLILSKWSFLPGSANVQLAIQHIRLLETSSPSRPQLHHWGQAQ